MFSKEQYKLKVMTNAETGNREIFLVLKTMTIAKFILKCNIFFTII